MANCRRSQARTRRTAENITGSYRKSPSAEGPSVLRRPSKKTAWRSSFRRALRMKEAPLRRLATDKSRSVATSVSLYSCRTLSIALGRSLARCSISSSSYLDRGPFLLAEPKICLQPAVLQGIDNIVGDPGSHRVFPCRPPTRPYNTECRSHPQRPKISDPPALTEKAASVINCSAHRPKVQRRGERRGGFRLVTETQTVEYTYASSASKARLSRRRSALKRPMRYWAGAGVTGPDTQKAMTASHEFRRAYPARAGSPCGRRA